MDAHAHARKENYDFLVKILLVGSSGVGKSAMIVRYADDVFDASYVSTIGVDFKIKTIELDGKIVKLQIWDTAGQERFRTLTSSYYRGAHGVVIVYDITDEHSFADVAMWLQEVRNYAKEHVARILVGNKCDLEARRRVTAEEARAFLAARDDYGDITFFETSAKDATRVDAAFHKVARAALDTLSGAHDALAQRTADAVALSSVTISTGSARKRCAC